MSERPNPLDKPPPSEDPPPPSNPDPVHRSPKVTPLDEDEHIKDGIEVEER